MKHVVVIGGSVAGLGAALALARDGHRVTVLERDATPMPDDHVEAFEKWDRRGAPQIRHSHAFLARLYCLIRDKEPALLAKLLERGASELRFTDRVVELFGEAAVEPGDEDLTLLATRRITFEWVLRRYVLDSGRVAFRDGDEVLGLAARAGTPPVVTGVELKRADGTFETLSADLVVDAGGRRSKLLHWLDAIGATCPPEESELCGIFYASRFYRLHEGASPPPLGEGMGIDLGYMKVGIFPGDAGIFSLTLAASPDDDPMRAILRERGFETAARAVPLTRGWVDPSVAAPISDVHGMANLRNTRRFFVKDGEPVALGIVAIGDAHVHLNPITGRGCTLAWVGAFLLADALREHPDDPRALALAVSAGIEREVVPWYRAQVAQDRDAIEVSIAQAKGDDPFKLERADGSQDPKAFMRSLLREGLGHAIRGDVNVFRAFMKLFNLMEAPDDIMRRPDIMGPVLAAWNDRHNRPPLVNGPARSSMLDSLAQASL